MNLGADTRPPRGAIRQRGLTLTELLIVVSIAAVLAAIALPNMSEFVQNNARSARLNDLSTAVNYARSNAVTQRFPAAFCASNAAGTACSAGVGDFANGILVVQANSSTVSRTALPGIGTGTTQWTRLRVISGTSAATFTLRGDAAFVIFEPNGMPAATVANVKFIHCDDRDKGQSLKTHARAIVLSATGHAAISRDSNGDGAHDINSVNLSCPA